MDEYENLDTYNGDAEHDMWVDFNNYENTGITNVFEENSFDNLIANLNDWD
ncbi:MAG: hypothetical protein HDS13_01940 [Bacteroides sp.]|nr:hypothetical protein [Bacteroides sp.]